MSDEISLDGNSKLDEAIADYLKAVEAGGEPDREGVLAAHPEFARELRAFFIDQDRFEKLAAPLKNAAAQAQTYSPDATEREAPGTRLHYFGDYELLEEVARGGMGVVYRARQVSLNRVVALKMILSGQLAGSAEVQRFRVEAEAAASLDHPNIVPIYEIGEHGGKQYFSMKLVEGGSLARGMARLVEDRRGAAELMSTVARAIYYAHQRGILHRDLKPANILLDKSGRPHITDFGLAKRVESESELTQSGAVVGTPAYMAPEQAAGDSKRLTTAADVYSLGAIFYEMLAGEPPFKADSMLGVLLKVRNEEPRPPRSLRAGVDRDLETICLKCLEKDAQRRYASAALLADDLDRWLRGEPITARPASAGTRVSKWVQRRPAVAALLALLMVAVLGGMAGVLWQWRNAEVARKAAEGKSRELSETMTLLTKAMNESKASEAAAKAAGTEAEMSAQRAQDAQRAAETQRQELRRTLYATDMQSALAAWVSGNLKRMQELLKRHEPGANDEDLRGFEWKLLQRFARGFKSEHRFADNSFMDWRVALSPDGREIVGFTPYAGQLLRWDVATGRIIGEANATVMEAGENNAGAYVAGARYASDGQSIEAVVNMPKAPSVADEFRHWASFTWNGKPALERVIGGMDRRTVRLKAPGKVEKVPFELAAANFPVNANLRRWESIALKDCLFSPNWMVASPDGKTMAMSGLKQFNYTPLDQLMKKETPPLRSGVLLWDIKANDYKLIEEDHPGMPAAIQYSADGKLLGWCNFDKTARIWDTAKNESKLKVELDRGGSSLSFSRDVTKLAIGRSDGTMVILDTASGTERERIRAHAGAVTSVEFAAGGLVVSAAQDGVKTWDLSVPQGPRILRGHEHVVQALAINGLTLVTGDSLGVIRRWNLENGQAVGEALNIPSVGRTNFFALAISPDGSTAAWGTQNEYVEIWEIATGKKKQMIPGSGLNLALNFSRDGKRLARTSYWSPGWNFGRWTNGRTDVTLLEAETGKVLRETKLDLFHRLGGAFAPDGETLALVGWPQEAHLPKCVQLVDVEKGEVKGGPVSDSDREVFTNVIYSADGNAVALIQGQETVTVWEVKSGKRRFTFKNPSPVLGLAFSGDGTRLALACGSPNSGAEVRILNAVSGAELLTLPAPGDFATKILFSEDGKRLVAATSTKAFNLMSRPEVAVVVWSVE